MGIQTLEFWIVVAGTVLVFWNIPRSMRYGMLALVSGGYLFWLTIDLWIASGGERSNPLTIPMFAAWVLLFYWLGPKAFDPEGGGRKRITAGLILLILGFLAFFKYIPPLIHSIAGENFALNVLLPLGISYFTFKLVHYAVEAGRGNIKERSLQQFCCYMFLFPIFTAGPIERYDHFLANRESEWSAHSMSYGLTRIAHGLIKQFVIADMLLSPMLRSYATVDLLLERLNELPTYAAWGFCVLTFLIGYMNFAAYSDIAIGISRLFGIRIMENFNWPIVAPNIGDFWKRWHMTLAGWCQAYVYMPTIGLTRNPYLAVYSTFLVMGLWHSGSIHWVFWGLHHATGVAVYLTWARYKRRRKLTWLDKPIFRPPAIGLTLLYVSVGTVYSSIHGTGSAYDVLRMLAKLVFIDLPPG